MQQEYHGNTLLGSPFITSILTPQLKRHAAELTNITDTDSFINSTPSYVILEDSIVWKHLESRASEVHKLLSHCITSMVLVLDKQYKKKLQLLDMGFTHCLDIPIATEVITKTVINTLAKHSIKSDRGRYEVSGPLSINYLHDSQGNTYLVQNKRSLYLTAPESGILEYLQRRKGYASRQELAYAGWKHFDVKPNTIIVAIKNLKRKIASAKLPYTITNLYGFGYMITSTLSDLRSNYKSH